MNLQQKMAKFEEYAEVKHCYGQSVLCNQVFLDSQQLLGFIKKHPPGTKIKNSTILFSVRLITKH